MKNEQRLRLATIDIVIWAISQRKPISKDGIVARWGVSRSTAWRWLKDLEDARLRVQILGIPPAPQYTRRPIVDSSAQVRP